MLHVHRILVSTIALVAALASLTACGQKGTLYLPTDPGAATRATLPQIINATLPYTSNPIPADSDPAIVPSVSVPATTASNGVFPPARPASATK